MTYLVRHGFPIVSSLRSGEAPRRAVRWAAALLVAISATACGTGKAPTVTPSHATIKRVATIHLRAFMVSHLGLTGNWVGFGLAPTYGALGDPTEVDAIDLRDGTRHLVARSAWKTGMMDWVEATNGWLFWTDARDEPMDDMVTTVWTIQGLQLQTGKRVMLARSRFRSPEPVPKANDGKLVWFEQTTRNKPTTIVRYFDTRTERVKTIITLPTPPNGIGAAPTGPIWDAMTLKYRSDLWTAPWSGGPARRLTTTGAARNLQMSPDGRLAAWELGNIGRDTGLAFGDPIR